MQKDGPNCTKENTGDSLSSAYSQRNYDIIDNASQTSSTLEIQLYKLRWWIIAFYVVQVVVIRFVTCSFGVVNNIYKAYYNLSFFVIDWFTLIQMPAGFVATVVLAYLTFSSFVRFRKLLIIFATTMLLACMLLMIAFGYPFLYWLIFFGQAAVGFGVQTSSAILPTLATSWFPEDQIGLAMGIRSTGISTGILLAFIVTSQMVDPPPSLQNCNENMTFSYINNNTDCILEWKNDVEKKFLTLFGTLLVLSIFALAFTLVYVTDRPPRPPSHSEALVRAQNEDEPPQLFTNMGKFVMECKSVIVNKVTFQLVIVGSITASANYLQSILMGEIVRDVFIARNYQSRVNEMSGYVLALHEVAGMGGSLVGGKILDRTKRHKALLLSALMVSLMMLSGFALGLYFINVAIIFITNTLLGFSLCAGYIPITDMILQHNFPKNTAFVMLIGMGEYKCLGIFISQISRVLLDHFGGLAVLIFLIALFCICIFVSIFLNPDYNRLAAENEVEEELLLFTNDEDTE